MPDAGIRTKLRCPCHVLKDAPAIVNSMKADILKSDFEMLLLSAATHPSAKLVATVAETTSWCRLWDITLNRGVWGTCSLQTLLKELSRRTYEGFSCRSCSASLSKDSLWFDHNICTNHPDVVNDLSCKEIISGLKEANNDFIFSVANSRLNSVHSGT